MPATIMERTDTVFAKTEKGREEMAKRSYGLNPAQRRVLILVDGSKDLDALAAMNPAMASSGQLEDTLAYLLEQDFIAAANASREQGWSGVPGGEPAASRLPSQTSLQVSAPQPQVTLQGGAEDPVAASAPAGFAAAAGGAGLTEDAATIRLVKDFMTTTAQTYLGLLSAPLIQRIEQARTSAQLMSVAGQWNMALRDSAQGRRFADPFLEQVKLSLTGGAGSLTGADA